MTDPAQTAAPATRRGLLKTIAALGVAGLTGAPLARASAPALTRVALIAPRRSHYPGLTTAFQDGLQAALRRQPVQLTTHLTGPLPREARAAVQTALEGGTDLLILLGDGLQTAVRDVLQGQAVPVIAAEPGARLPGPGVHAAPLTVTVSLQAWEAEWAHGAHLARTGEPLHLLISALDSGYDLPYAFTAGFTSGGGPLTGTTVTDGSDPATLLRTVRQSGARAVHLLSSGGGADLARTLVNAGLRVTAGGLSAPAVQALVPTALGARHHHPSLRAPLGTDRPDPFLTLGFDTGQWIAAALQAAPAAPPLTRHAALLQATVTAARGPLRADAQGLLRAPLLLRTPGRPDLTLAPPAPGRPELQPGELRSGWLHTYLHA
ncbi:hypothetical protein [Deinococcus depolymerans]|uniref:ABC transporter substrate-binding protein n=1 Tax=Deinococcus depolymerans TaxID=392408 RepID=A0ABN1BNN3_9DEIO